MVRELDKFGSTCVVSHRHFSCQFLIRTVAEALSRRFGDHPSHCCGNSMEEGKPKIKRKKKKKTTRTPREPPQPCDWSRTFDAEISQMSSDVWCYIAARSDLMIFIVGTPVLCGSVEIDDWGTSIVYRCFVQQCSKYGYRIDSMADTAWVTVVTRVIGTDRVEGSNYWKAKVTDTVLVH